MNQAIATTEAVPAAERAAGTKTGQRSGLPLKAIGSYAVLVLLAAFFMFPLLFMFVGSLKPSDIVLVDGSSWRAFIPFGASLANFGEAAARADVGHLFINSLLITLSTVALGLVVNSLFGYALARFRFVGRGVVVAVVIALVIIPLEAYAIPLFYMMAQLQWLDTYYVQILPFIANPFYIYLFYTFFLSLPKELEEQSQLDGANPLVTFWRIMVPLARPAYATVAILSFLYSWGQLLWPVLVTRGPDVRPLPLGIAEFQTLPPIQWGDIMAFATVMTLPLLVVFLIFQNAFVQGVARSGLKG
ncbi:MAG: carbohydrate ABC transporter permease [Ktedonobacterales bacterium]|nr:carbohydrate ABC transporter permease [Ktedonobacterales bacterium]